VAKIAPLRNDAFQSHFAGVLKDGLAMLVELFREPHPLSSPREKLFQFCFALFKGMVSVILTIQFEQVEGIQKDLLVMGT
jgi:hypothetical protein